MEKIDVISSIIFNRMMASGGVKIRVRNKRNAFSTWHEFKNVLGNMKRVVSVAISKTIKTRYVQGDYIR